MHETYRMLGREHEADLAREAAKWQLADEVRNGKNARTRVAPATRPRRLAPISNGCQRMTRLLLAWLTITALLAFAAT